VALAAIAVNSNRIRGGSSSSDHCGCMVGSIISEGKILTAGVVVVVVVVSCRLREWGNLTVPDKDTFCDSSSSNSDRNKKACNIRPSALCDSADTPIL